MKKALAHILWGGVILIITLGMVMCDGGTDSLTGTGGTGGSGGSGSSTGTKIFVTASFYNGSLGGVSGADNKCMSDSNKPDSNTYKALIVGDEGGQVTRSACSTANCGGGSSENVNWVLKPNTTYYRSDGTTKIMTTNSSGIFVFGTLDNLFLNAPNGTWWTGLNSDWTTNSNNCSGWTSTSGNGIVGGIGITDSQAISGSSPIACTFSYHLVCVEQ